MKKSKELHIIIPAFTEASWLQKDFAGQPLMFWTVKAALQCACDEVWVYTNNAALSASLSAFFGDERLYTHCQSNGTPEQLWQCHAASPDTAIMLLQANAPLIDTNLLQQAYQQWLAAEAQWLCSGKSLTAPLRNVDGQPLTSQEGLWEEDGILRVGYFEHFPHSMPATIQICSGYLLPPAIQRVADGPSFAAALAHHRETARTKALEKKTAIKLFLTDVDGVMTDAGMYYIEGGQEFKKFHVHDGMALQLLQKSGVKTGIITSEDTEIVSKRAARLKVDYLHQGKRFGGKLQAAQDICAKEGITLQEVAYIGDDINCLDLLQAVGIAACPANATRHVKAIPGIWQLERGAGEGVVREMIEKLFPEVI